MNAGQRNQSALQQNSHYKMYSLPPRRQSALGHQRRWTNVHVMSAYPATADKILQTMVGRSGP